MRAIVYMENQNLYISKIIHIIYPVDYYYAIEPKYIFSPTGKDLNFPESSTSICTMPMPAHKTLARMFQGSFLVDRL